MTLTDKIQEIKEELLIAKDRNRLTNEGATLLQMLQSGVATESVGSLLQGLSLNLSDEAIGSLRTIFSDVPKKAAGMLKGAGVTASPAEVGRAIERLGLEEYRAQYPGRAISTELVGGALPAFLSRGRTAPETITMATTKAVPLGAISGGGAAEGTLAERAPEAATGAVISGVATPTLQIGGRVIGKGYRSAVDSIFSSPNRLGKDAARDAISEALRADIGSVDEALSIVLSKANKPYTLADIGPNTRAYLDAASVLPGPGKKEAISFLEQRDKGLLSRLTSDIQDAFGTRASFFDEFNALKEARSELGKKLYDRAFKVQVPVTTELTALLKRPSVQEAYSRATSIANERGVKLPDVVISPDGKLLTSKGDEVKTIDTAFLHFMKMGLDDLVFTGKSPTSGVGKTLLNDQKDTRSLFINYVDRNNKSYQKARNYWADDTAAMDAMQSGRNFLKMDYDELAADLKKMSESEKEAFRLGAMQQLLDRMGGAQVGETVMATVGSPARDVLKNPKNVRMLRLTFPEGEGGEQLFKKFVSNLKDEVEMKVTSTDVLRGSQTAARTEAVKRFREVASVEQPPAGSLLDVLLTSFRRDFGKQIEEQRLRAMAGETARILTETNPAKLQQVIKDLQGGSALNVLRRTAPEVLPSVGRALLGPYAISSLSGQAAPPVTQAMPGLLNMFGQ